MYAGVSEHEGSKLTLEATAVQTRDQGKSLQDWRAWAPVPALVVVTFLLYFGKLAGLRPPGGERLWLWPVVALAEWLAVYQGFPIRTRTFSTTLATDGIACMIAAAFLSPLNALLAVFCGHFVANLQHPRSMAKKFMGSMMAVTSLSLAMIVYHGLLGGASPVSPFGWLCIVVALVVLNGVDGIGIVSYIKWVNRVPKAPVKEAAAEGAIEVVVNSAGSVIAITLIWASTLATLLLAGVLAAVTVGRRIVARSSHQDRTVKEVFGHIARMAAASGGENELIPAILEEGRKVLVASKASLMAPLSRTNQGTALRWTLAGDGPAALVEGPVAPGFGPIVMLRGAVVAKRGTQDPLLKRALVAEGVAEAVAVPLSPTGVVPGYLMVGDRPYAHEGFVAEDVKVLETIAANAAMVLRRTGIMERLRRESAARLHDAYHDSLTGLPNRAHFSQRLERCLREAEDRTLVGLLLLDLDGFKQVNETLGFKTGDAVLAEVSRRLEVFVGEKAFVARLGGDEFVLVLEDAPGDEKSLETADRMLTLTSLPMTVEGVELAVGGSVGVVVESARQTTAGRLLRKADVAMYRAKGHGGGVSLYDSASDSSSLRRLSLATELRKALEAGDLQLHYQPVIDLESGKVLFFEALARWSHEQFGPIGPDEFIPVAERSGLIDPLTWWALETALAQLKQWQQVAPDLAVAVNLSPRSVASPELVQRVEAVLSRSQLMPGALRLELTESSVTGDIGHDALKALAGLGVKLSIDDFGTGYSSLARLREMPFDEVKIDGTFVSHMCQVDDDEALVRSIIHLAQGLDKMATAEGVEDKQILERLASLGCHAVQGYYLARPQPATQCSSLLADPYYPPTGPRGVPNVAPDDNDDARPASGGSS